MTSRHFPKSTLIASFRALSTTLTWAAGDGSPRVVEVDLIDDTLAESSESFTATLRGVSGSVLQNSTTVVTLLDDEALPEILAGLVSLTLREGLIAEFSVQATSVLPLTYQWQNLASQACSRMAVFSFSMVLFWKEAFGQFKVQSATDDSVFARWLPLSGCLNPLLNPAWARVLVTHIQRF